MNSQFWGETETDRRASSCFPVKHQSTTHECVSISCVYLLDVCFVFSIKPLTSSSMTKLIWIKPAVGHRKIIRLHVGAVSLLACASAPKTPFPPSPYPFNFPGFLISIDSFLGLRRNSSTAACKILPVCLVRAEYW
jgi:hypothetical protein